MSKKQSFSGTTEAGSQLKVKIVVLPGNVALVSPPAEELGPLLDYQEFALGDGHSAGEPPGDAAAHASDLGPCSAFPAGFVPRFRDALVANGYHVTVDDRRPDEKLQVNMEQYGSSHGEARAFLQAVLAEPLGQVTYARWHDFLWRIGQLCYLYPEARVLIV